MEVGWVSMVPYLHPSTLHREHGMVSMGPLSILVYLLEYMGWMDTVPHLHPNIPPGEHGTDGHRMSEYGTPLHPAVPPGEHPSIPPG